VFLISVVVGTTTVCVFDKCRCCYYDFVFLISVVVGSTTVCDFDKCRCWYYDCFCFSDMIIYLSKMTVNLDYDSALFA